MPGINCVVWGAEAGRNGKTLSLKDVSYAGLCFRSYCDFTPRKSSVDLQPLRDRERPRRATPSSPRGAPSALPLATPPTKRTPGAAKAAAGAQLGVLRRGELARSCPLPAGSAAAGLPPSGQWSLARRGQKQPSKGPARGLRATEGSACLALYFFERQLRQPLPALPGCQDAGAAGQIQLCAPAASPVLGTWGDAPVGGLRTPGQEPL